MLRLAASYLGISIGLPIAFLLAYTGGNLLVSGLMLMPLVVTAFAFQWLVLEVARRDNLLTQRQFLKASVLCGLSALLLIAGATELLAHFAPAINLGVALSEFRMMYFTAMMFLPTLVASALVGTLFWYSAVRGNGYIQAYPARGTKTGSTWFTLPRSKRKTGQAEIKKAA